MATRWRSYLWPAEMVGRRGARAADGRMRRLRDRGKAETAERVPPVLTINKKKEM